MAKCKSCDCDIAEHVNFCPNCGVASGRRQEGIYTDEEVQGIAENLARELRESSPSMINILVTKSEEYRRGPFGIMSVWSNRFNPKGRFPVEAEALTIEQKAIITNVVGKAMSQLGIDHPDYEKNKRKSEESFMNSINRNKSSVSDRDWDLEQRMKNKRNHDF